MKIYSLDTTDFTYNGFGFLTDVLNAQVHEEINGEYVLDMEYLLNGALAEYLVRENIIVCKVADGTEQPFRIKYIDRNFKTIIIKAYHISYDLADDLVINTAPTNLNAQAFGRWVLNNSTTHASTYTFNSDIATTNSARYIRKNVLECFMSDDDNSMLNKFGGEFKRNGYTIDFKARLGEDTGVKLLIGKNINEIKITTDDTSLFTRICPVGYDGLTLPEIYVDSVLINNYPFPKGCVVKFEDIKYDETGEDPDAYSDIDDFYDALRAAAHKMYDEGMDKPLINVNVDWLDLSKTKEYENYTSLETIRLGDTLTCDMDDFQFTTRVIATIYDVLLDRITNFQIGKPIANYATQTNATIQEIESQDLSSLLDQAQQNASNLLKNAMTGYIYFDYEHGNLYIMDNPDPDDAEKVWRWNLNGLGYSSTGINGTYGLAITMDGSIVADYITTGHLNTNVIQGYDSLVSYVEDLENLLIEDEGIGTITIEGASKNVPYYVKIYPTSNNVSSTYPFNGLYPSNDLYMANRTLRFTNTNSHETFDYELPCDLLYYDDSHYDSLVIDGLNMKCIKTKMVNYTSSGTTEIAPTESIEYPYPFIELTEGDYSIGFINYNSVHLKVQLIKKNDLTDLFASSIYTNSKITQTQNEIELEVQKKVSDDEIIAKINLAVEDEQGIIEIKSNQITIDSDNFHLDAEGNIECQDAVMDDAIINNATITGGNLVMTGDERQPKITILDRINEDKGLVLSSDGIRHYGNINNINDGTYVELSQNGYIFKEDGIDLLYSGRFTTTDNQAIEYGIELQRTDNMHRSFLGSSYFSSYEMYANNFINTSSKEKKKNIEKLKNGLDILKDIDIYTYNYNEETKKSNKKHYGVVIGDDYNYSKEITNNTNEGVNLYSFISICCASIKEQQEQIEELKKEIKSLKEGKK